MQIDKSDRLSLSRLLQMIIFSVDESGKSIVKLQGKSGENNIRRVLFPTQICQFWDTVGRSVRLLTGGE